jgi:hypothetical protein
MHEPAKAVIALALSTAAAVWLLGVAFHLWPDADQLAYGNPLPYLKVRMDSGVVRFWVEDFGGLQYERVWLYVNGRLAASGGAGTDAAAKCGDEVAAVVKYHSGTKKLEGRILCTKPIKAPGGSQQIVNSHFEIRTVLAAQDAAGNADVSGLPVDVVGSCEVRPSDGYYNFVVQITPRSPDVLICDASGCSPSKTYSSNCPLTYSTNNCPPLSATLYSGPVDVLKTAGAPLAQYAGGGRLWLNLYVYYSGAYPYGWYVAMNGTTLAYCPRPVHSDTVTDVRTWTEYKEANASAIYHLYLQWPDGTKTKATVAIYENKGGDPPYGFRVISSGTSQPPPPANIRIHTRYGPANTTVEPITMLDALKLNSKFLEYLNSDPQARTLFVEALRYPTTVEFNIPKINVTYTETVVKHILIQPSAYGQSGRVLFIQVPYSFSLGAVLAATVLPVNITKPPANVTTLSGGTAYVFSR